MSDDKFTCEQISISGAPPITFVFDGDLVTAELAGARLAGCAVDLDRCHVRLTDASGLLLADLVLNARAHRTLTENVMDVGSALLWSHARYVAALPGETVVEKFDRLGKAGG